MWIFLSVFRLFVYTAHRMSHSWIPPFILFRFYTYFTRNEKWKQGNERREQEKKSNRVQPAQKMVCVCVRFVVFNIGPEKLLWLLTFVGCLKMCAVKCCVPLPNSMCSICYCATYAYITLHLPKRKQWDEKPIENCHNLVWLVRAYVCWCVDKLSKTQKPSLVHPKFGCLLKSSLLLFSAPSICGEQYSWCCLKSRIHHRRKDKKWVLRVWAQLNETEKFSAFVGTAIATIAAAMFLA